jgi:4-alpha-glucanotransferase
MEHSGPSSLFQQRRAGVLLHPTSLPSNSEVGNIGEDAYRFVDFMAKSGLSIWQMLPIGPTHSDLSPYQSLSTHAGSSRLICQQWLFQHDWLTKEDVCKTDSLDSALKHCAEIIFKENAKGRDLERRQQFHTFCTTNAYWLTDFSLFQTLREIYPGQPWNQWPNRIKQRDSDTLKTLQHEHAATIRYYCFEQFIFSLQWQALRNYAHSQGVYLFGDIPIFVAHDSADVWANQRDFRLDSEGNPLTVAGVPPDYFSETGQHWGNPHYDWEVMQADGFQWWLARLRSQLQLFDLIRIDHFRGFEAFWEIPGNDKDARNGRWVKAPGRELLRACFEAYPNLPLVAENLGVITEDVEALRREFNLPGMLVLQFGFDGNALNPHLPHHHKALDVVYTGTHDNDTTLGWYNSLDARSSAYLSEYFCGASDPMPWLLIKAGLSSVAQMTLIPMQDWLSLDGQHRMNMPGTVNNNWNWRFCWEQVPETLPHDIRHLVSLYGRV